MTNLPLIVLATGQRTCALGAGAILAVGPCIDTSHFLMLRLCTCWVRYSTNQENQGNKKETWK